MVFVNKNHIIFYFIINLVHTASRGPEKLKRGEPEKLGT